MSLSWVQECYLRLRPQPGGPCEWTETLGHHNFLVVWMRRPRDWFRRSYWEYCTSCGLTIPRRFGS